MRFVATLLLLSVAVLAEGEEIEFGKDPVPCKPIGCEVRVPVGWKVAKDRTGLSAQGKEGGFVITREPLLVGEKEFPAKWRGILAQAGIATEVKTTRAGRYRAFFATWPAPNRPDRVLSVYRIYVEDLEMLYNVSFSTPKGAPSEALVEGVLKSFKVTADEPDLEFEQSPISVGQAGTMKIPKGCVETKVGRFGRSTAYRKTLPGYEKPKLAVEIRADSVPAQYRLPTGGTTSNPEDLIRYTMQQMGLQNAAWDGKPKNKPGSHGGMKGEALTGRFRHESGDMVEVYLWCGKGKTHSPVILVVASERETRLHRHYFKAILKTFKANR